MSDGTPRPWHRLARRRWARDLAADARALAVASPGGPGGDGAPKALAAAAQLARRALARAEPALQRQAVLRTLAAVAATEAARRGSTLPPSVLDAALALRHAGAVELARLEDRRLATALAAASAALAGEPVHVVTANDDEALAAAEAMRPVIEACGLRCAAPTLAMSPADLVAAYGAGVVVAGVRRLASDLARDAQLATRLGADGPVPRLVPPAGQAFVEPLDRVLADDALGPIVLSVADDPTHLGEALAAACRFVDTLEPGLDHHDSDLSDRGRDRLAADLSRWPAAWRGQARSEALARQALFVRDGLAAGRDYTVLAPGSPGNLWLDDSLAERLPEREFAVHLLQALQLRLGLPLNPITRTVGRSSVPAFFAHYGRLAGCAPCLHGLDGELWRSHGLLRFTPAPLPVTRLRTLAVADQPSADTTLAQWATEADVALARLIVLRRAGDAPRLQARVAHPRAAWALESVGPQVALQTLAEGGPLQRLRVIFAEPPDHRRAGQAWLHRAADALPTGAPAPEALQLIAADSRWLAQRLPLAATAARWLCRAWPAAAPVVLPPLVWLAQALAARLASAHRIALPERERQLQRQLSFTANRPAPHQGRSP